MYNFNKAVVIGRFQPFHKGHGHMIREALKIAETVYIVIGSASAFPNTKNPFTKEQRVEMIRNWGKYQLEREEMERIEFAFVDDYLYNEQRWKMEVRLAIEEQPTDKVVIVGAYKDAGSYWLKGFGWTAHDVGLKMVNGKPISATDYRHEYFRSDVVMSKSSDMIPAAAVFPSATMIFLMKFRESPEYARLREEQLQWDKELEKFKDYPYAASLNCNTADSVVVCNNHVLLIERKFSPGKGALALAGGHKNADETFLDCAIRELMEEVKIKVPEKVLRGSIKNSWLFDHPNRSAYICKPTVAQYIVIEPNEDGSLPRVRGADDAAKAFWMPMHEVSKNRARFFDDHYQIIVAFTGI